ncbi:glutathione S-transferase family protein [Aquamicrobium sp. LC103]|uniref:glutathione S-transferase family protein n=1 Tax=Aquamicrobium sp. LC103 TaxID=1120658 RepID=UPI00063ECB41|nr:glutathione S-transferase family protein [Aquamicrobium sp. LC103]TKT76894.1 glutathione S-transferase family protein [Aquamicrobium sp. LC103]
MTGKPRLFGSDYSVYVRIARLVLLEKGVDHEVMPVDVFTPGGPPAWYRDHHPFSKIPAFEHGAFRLFETSAITRYVDDAFDGPALQPSDARRRAVMNQIIGLLDAYAYRTLVWDIYVERVSKPRDGKPSDEARIAAAIPVAETCLATLSRLKSPGPWLLGDTLTLADLHAAPIFAYFLKAPEAAPLMKAQPELVGWWGRIGARPSFLATEPTS